MSTDLELVEKARKAIMEDDTENAESCYKAVLEAKSTNLEARWFVSFFAAFRAYEEKDFSTVNVECGKMELVLSSVLNRLNESSDKDFRKKVAKEYIVYGYLTFKTVIFELDPSGAISMARMIGEKILELLGDDSPESISAAVHTWKTAVRMRHTWCAYRHAADKDKETWYDEMVKKIQKYEPSYEAPKFEQAGCVSVGDKAKEVNKIRPGF